MVVQNEQAHLADAVESILGQTWDGPLEVVVAVGPSVDSTREIAEQLAQSDSRVVVVDNPSGRTPDGLNVALATARGDILVRVDGHCTLPVEYVATAVEALERTGADNVGGIMSARGVTAFEQAVACAMTSALGVGNAPFHVGGQEGPVDTVYLGVFRRAALERVGGYDPRFSRAQDWELNYRLRQTGGVVWFVPALKVRYRPRESVSKLSRQYLNYGRWRRRMVKEYPDTVSTRYLAPPAAVIAIAVGTTAALAGLVVGQTESPRTRRVAKVLSIAGALPPAAYAGAVVVGGLYVGRRLPRRAKVLVPVALATMHMSWGMGFVQGSCDSET